MAPPRHRMNAARRHNTRWSCPHCGTSGWDSSGQQTSGRFDHDRPDGRKCQAAAADLAKGKGTVSSNRLMARAAGGDSLEVTIPTMGWEQINGDMDPGAYGGTIAHGDGSTLDLLKIQPVREYVGDSEAADVGFPFWTKEASFDANDLDTSKSEVQSAMQSVGLEMDALRDMTPTVRALALADALLDYGRGDEGQSGWSEDIIHQPVKWSGGQVAGAEYLADEDEAFRNEVLGYDDIRAALEAKVGEYANRSSAEGWSTIGDETRDQLEEAGFDAETAVGVAEFGEAVAANGDIEPDLTLAGVEGKLESEGYEDTGLGGRIPTDEAEVQTDHVVSAVAEELERSEEDVEAAAKGLDWWGKTVAWSTSGDGSVWAKRKDATATTHEMDERRAALDPSKPLDGAGVAYFDIDGDPESLDIRPGEVPVDVVMNYMRGRRLNGTAQRGRSPGEIVVNYTHGGQQHSFTTRVKVQSRKGTKTHEAPRSRRPAGHAPPFSKPAPHARRSRMTRTRRR